MTSLRRGRTRSVRRRRYHLKLPFWIYCVLTILAALVAINTGLNLLFWAFGVMASALLVSGVVSGGMMMALDVRRILPAHAAVGEPLFVRYAVRNRARLLPAFSVWFEEASEAPWRRLMEPAVAWVMHIGPRELVHGEAIFVPDRRGRAEFDEIVMSTVFPFGLIRKSISTSQPQHVLVHPRLYRLQPRVLASISTAGGLGSRVTAHAGAGDDYFGLREYRRGDSMRNIAWRRTANRDQLLTIEHTHPEPPRLRVVLDLSRPPAADDPAAAELEEHAITLAASLIHAADIAGYEVGLTIYGIDAPVVPVRRNYWQSSRIMGVLAAIDLDEPRRPGPPPATREPETAAMAIVHPDRIDLDLASEHATHFSARQLESLVEGELRGDERGDLRLPPEPVE